MLYTVMQLQIIFWDYEPKKVIILHNTEASEEAKNKINEFLKEYNPILLHQGLNYELEKEGLIEKVFHLTGERKSVYDVGVSCSQAWFDVRLDKKCLINIIPNEDLPLERTITINVDHAKTIGLFAKFEVIPYELLEEVKLSDFKTKKVKITLKIDINLLYKFIVDPIGPIVQPPSSSPKVRVVFYPKHFSVYFQNKNKESILEDFDDSKKIPLYISFNEKKPIIGNPALKLYSTKPKFVVFDLIKLSCISNIESANPKYKFKLDKEDETFMITVETFEGERRLSVQFLLALILKHALLLVKNETGKKMEEMEIEFDSVSENEILKKNFEDAGKLINVKVVFD
uniref:Uncharacterized protein n=1 Tax=Panagrolaimus sp. PS1159 TaxID=55785 RepID=A0AC35FWB5_9BILA